MFGFVLALDVPVILKHSIYNDLHCMRGDFDGVLSGHSFLMVL